MKGIILAGGYGTRLRPITKIVNKHLLPVCSYPIIYYPIYTLISMGIEDILIIDNGDANVARFLGEGDEFGVEFTYKIQEEPKGIAHGIMMAEAFAGDDEIAVALGDNIFLESMMPHVEDYNGEGAIVFLKEVSDPNRFGVAQINDEKVVKIEEKPSKPKSNLAVTGLYIYDNYVFDIAKTLKPSARGELEVTDINNAYIRSGNLEACTLQGFWSDAGTFDSLSRVSEYVKDNPPWWFVGR